MLRSTQSIKNDRAFNTVNLYFRKVEMTKSMQWQQK